MALFGTANQSAGSGLFGQPANAAGGSNSLFGQPAGGGTAPTGGLFGAPQAPPAGNSFKPVSAPATGGLFGAPQAQSQPPSMTQPAAQSTGGTPTLFGAPPTTSGSSLFGAPPKPQQAEQPQQQQHLLQIGGAPAKQPAGGLFGAPVAAGGTSGETNNLAPKTLSAFGESTKPFSLSSLDPNSGKNTFFGAANATTTTTTTTNANAAAADAQAKPQASSLFGGAAPTKPVEEQKVAAAVNSFGPILTGKQVQNNDKEQSKYEETKQSAFASNGAIGGQENKTNLFGAEKKVEGASATDAKKNEGEILFTANQAIVQVKKSEEDAQKEAFMGKMFDQVSQKWITTVNTNEKHFNKSIEQLQTYEWLLIKQMSEIERLEAEQKQVTKAYHASFDELSGITSQQNNVLNELSTIEQELDKFLQSHAYGAKKASSLANQQAALLQGGGSDLMRQIPSKDRIFQQAADLEQEIKQMNSNLNGCVNKIASADNDYAQTANKYLGQQATDSVKVQNVEMVEKSLAMFYESMKWIENSSIDMQFQLEKVQTRLNNHM